MGTATFTAVLPAALAGEVESENLLNWDPGNPDQQTIVKTGNGTRPTIVPIGPSQGKTHRLNFLTVGTHSQMRAEVAAWQAKKGATGTLVVSNHNGVSGTHTSMTLLEVIPPYPWRANGNEFQATFLEAS